MRESFNARQPETLFPEAHPAKDNIGRVRYTDHISGNGERLFEKARSLNLEGMMMKRKDSVYSGLRSRDWFQVKTRAGQLAMKQHMTSRRWIGD
jgi:ATP-dependent DNA ligase